LSFDRVRCGIIASSFFVLLVALLKTFMGIVLPKVTKPVAAARAATANKVQHAAEVPLRRRSQICNLFDADSSQNWKRHSGHLSTWVGALLSTYIVARLALSGREDFKFDVLTSIQFFGNSNAIDPNRIITSLSPHRPELLRRRQEFPAILKHLLQLCMSMARLLSMMQLHLVFDNPDKLTEFAQQHPDHTDLGFVRKMWILGRLRHLKIIDYFSECGNAMTSLDDLERFKQECRVDLSSIERTFELSTLP
jgi:hypothetical protein